MNDKNRELLRIVEVVVECCSMDVGDGRKSVSVEDVMGKNRHENVVMTRAMAARQIAWAGYSVSTIAMLLGRSVAAVRNLLKMGDAYHQQSRAYRIAEAEAVLKCREEKGASS